MNCRVVANETFMVKVSTDAWQPQLMLSFYETVATLSPLQTYSISCAGVHYTKWTFTVESSEHHYVVAKKKL